MAIFFGSDTVGRLFLVGGASIFLTSVGTPNLSPVRECLAAPIYEFVSCASDAQAAILVSNNDELALLLIQQLRTAHTNVPVLLITQHGSERLAVAAFQSGVSAYLNESWTRTELSAVVDRLICSTRHVDGLAGPVLIGNSPAMVELREYVRQVSPTDCSVLILGETGTGKELIAESIHANSARRNHPFVCLNTAAIPDTLVESELFGHERGAFTGATSRQTGKLIFATGGTVFFDEIGDVSPAVQSKLLRAIESRSVYRLGSNCPVDLDIRLVAATNQDLDKEMKEGRFRRDLFYRLSVIRILLPPLRDRREDVPLLIDHFFRHYNLQWKRRLTGVSPQAMDALIAHNWPGNVRELRNVVEAVFASLSPEMQGSVDIPPQVLRHLSFTANSPETERDRILKALVATNWNRSKASEQLHWSRMTLYRKMQKHQLAMSHPLRPERRLQTGT
jgi:DNA-binding NtrC family response regulator